MTTYTGTSGADTWTGTSDNDIANGLGGNDTLSGAGGDDILNGGTGADALDGGDGFDYASYANATTAIFASLANPSANTGEALGDTYANIEGLIGSVNADTLVGDANDNILSGGNSNDTLIGGAGADVLDGGGGTGDIASYAGASGGVTVDLTNGANNTGDAAGDTFIGIEVWQGSSFDDVFVSSAVATTFKGGAGNDVYYVDSASDVVTENASEGVDTVYTTSTSYTLAVNVENLTYLGSANFTGTGNASANTIVGGDGNDTLIGGAGADALDGGAGYNTASYSTSTTNLVVSLANPASNTGDAAGDTYANIQNLVGGTGLDTLIGDWQDNSLNGGNSSDTLIGGAGADALNGGADIGDVIDTASYATAGSAVTVDLTNLANNTGDAAGDTYISIETFQGSNYDDLFISSATLNTTFKGGAGNDTYYVDSASDAVTENASEGNDTVYASGAAFTLGTNVEALIYTGSGNFSGTGNASNNILTGGAGNDTLSGLAGADALNGGDGDDILIGGAGADAMDGGAGNNTASYSTSTTNVVASLANAAVNTGDATGDTYAYIQNLTGGTGLDTLIGDAGDNILSGGNSNDTLIGGAGADVLDGGGATADIASYAGASGGVTVDLTNGANNAGDAAGDTYIGIEVWQGSSFDDVFVSPSSLVTTFKGGAGNDVYYVDSTADVVTENAGEGVDTVYTSATSYALGANLENLTYQGVANFTGTGNASANTMIGGDGNDVLIGGAGADALDGGAGANTASYSTSTTNVVASLANPASNTSDAAGDTYANIQNLTGGTGLDTLIGDWQDNILSGGNSNDVLIGGAGADTLDGGGAIDTASYAGASGGVTVDLTNGANNAGDAAGDTFIGVEVWQGSSFDDLFISSAALNTTFQGGAGDDTYYVDSASDAVTENASEGNDTVYASGVAFTLGTNVETLIYAGSGAFAGTGNATNNTITGGAGNDTLSGLGGADALNGQDGNDILIGGAGADAMDGGAGNNTASYSTSTTDLVASLANAAANTGDAAGDTFANIQNLTGGFGLDTLIGDDQNNILSGGNSNDTLIGGAGADVLDGGGATGDIASYATASDGVAVDLTNGANNAGDAAGDTYIGIEVFKGSAYADTFVSSAAVNSDFRGGAGDDVYYVDSAADLLTENAGEGVDTVYATAASYVLAANIENLTYTGSGNFTGTGNASANILIGSSGNDVLIGGAGADALDGGGGTNTASYSTSTTNVVASLANSAINAGDAAGDTYANIENLTGGFGLDTLVGDDQANVLSGGNSNDTLIGGAGADVLDGGGATDTASYAGASGAVTVDLVNGANNAGDAAGDTYIGVEAWQGTDFGDTFVSSASLVTTFKGGLGDDVYYVDSTSDVVTENAGEGIDSVYTTAATYVLGANLENLTYQGSANFTGTGNASANAIVGGAGNDILIGGLGADALDGQGGVNTASYVNESSSVVASLADSSVNTGEAAGDTYANIQNLTGGVWLDTLIGNDQNNVLNGGNSSDTLIGGAGADTLIGGADIGDVIDTASYATAGSAVTVDLSNVANNTGDAAGDTYSAVEAFIGSSFDDSFKSSSTVNTIFQGGLGDDVYYVDSASDSVTESAGQGADTVYATSSSFTLGANVETLIYAGSGNFTGTGGSTDNTIIGGAGNDILIGGLGADALDGQGGVNTASYANETSAVVASLADSSVNTGEAAGDTYANIQNLTGGLWLDTLIGDANNNVLSGGNSNDVLIGGGGADVLDGGGATDTASYAGSGDTVTVDLTNLANNTNDAVGDTYVGIEVWQGTDFGDLFVSSAALNTTFQGGLGDDVYRIDSASDVVTENASAGVDTVYTTTASYTLGANVENLVYAGSGAFSGTGNALANAITGGGGADVLAGAGGADVLTGGSGNDLFDFNALSDSGGSAIDVVFDFASGDKIDLSTIDADSGLSGNQAFHIDGTIGGSGDVDIYYDSVIDAMVINLYVNNDASIDATIWVAHQLTLTSADFVL